jgi:septal ring factor EnvC (AmiA/AmiB activator)
MEEANKSMWPKVIAQLFELLPHITRLVPMADRYFSSKTASEKANEAAMAAMAEAVRSDLGQVTKAHAGLYRQLQDQSAQIAEVSEEVKRARLSIEQDQHRLSALEANLISLGRWVKAGVSLLVVLLAVIIVLLLRGR